jgi:hypothetical protein
MQHALGVKLPVREREAEGALQFMGIQQRG